jgi:hypothetical protein
MGVISMSEALYVSMFVSPQSSARDRRSRWRRRLAERLGRFAIYGAAVSGFAIQASDPTFYASVGVACSLLLECLR